MPDEQRVWLEHLRDNPTEAEIEAMCAAEATAADVPWPYGSTPVIREYVRNRVRAARRALFNEILEGK